MFFSTRKTLGALGFVGSIAASSRMPSFLFAPPPPPEVREFRISDRGAPSISTLVTRAFRIEPLKQDWKAPLPGVDLFDNKLVSPGTDPALNLKVGAPKSLDGAGEAAAQMGNFYMDRFLPLKGDTLRTVATRLGCIPELLALHNEGSTLDQPLDPTRSIEVYRGPVTAYTTQAGDTLWSISKRFRVPLREILWLNRLRTLVLPVGRQVYVARGVVSPEVGRRASQDLPTSVLLARAKQEMRDGEDSGANLAVGTMVSRPVTGEVTSGFGWRRHPILKKTSFHRGIDIRAGEGTPIRAMDDGLVVFAGDSGAGGKSVILRHKNQLYSIYAHCALVNVAKGERVTKGTTIGRVGKTGLATAPHLHFAMKRGESSIDPLPFIR